MKNDNPFSIKLKEYDMNQEICHCRKVPFSIINQLIQKGVKDLPQLIQRSQAGTGCGTCRNRLIELLEISNKK